MRCNGIAGDVVSGLTAHSPMAYSRTMGRHREYNVDQVIDAALHAFWARGFGATSISDLVDVTGINRASLYSVFKDKRGLFHDQYRA
jgi:AcrR family transcriptional regulator